MSKLHGFNDVKDIAEHYAANKYNSEFENTGKLAFQPEDVEVIFGYYGTDSGYDGDSFVLFKRDGKLFEANGSHCSCYGLEGQWHPEETSKDALVMRRKNGSFGSNWDYNIARDLDHVLEAL